MKKYIAVFFILLFIAFTWVIPVCFSEPSDTDSASQCMAITEANQKLTEYAADVKITGYVICKTKSCSLNMPISHTLPDVKCAPNSGYFIISDDSSLIIDFNPARLKNRETLVYFVPDAVIDKLVLGKKYKISGRIGKYSDIPAIEFVNKE